MNALRALVARHTDRDRSAVTGPKSLLNARMDPVRLQCRGYTDRCSIVRYPPFPGGIFVLPVQESWPIERIWRKPKWSDGVRSSEVPQASVDILGKVVLPGEVTIATPRMPYNLWKKITGLDFAIVHWAEGVQFGWSEPASGAPATSAEPHRTLHPAFFTGTGVIRGGVSEMSSLYENSYSTLPPSKYRAARLLTVGAPT
ncbi:uncharacterized protein H6S33_008007 [Morchella sextelata]|uniref:uncharacterized protein n=1 Tax=Morchella sextelata TaxID=1174677 RepID=UPI001D04AB1E|nr:uncharacterized protein H6S33_008007 [Morchella sextelata]KAH0603003.1 hypothetical protein H6S33_008007 [Morchella sextelata]